MSGTSTNLGKQEVSIYPGQELSSVYGSAILNDVVPIGTTNCVVTLSDSGANVSVTIASGSTFVFKRSAPDPITSIAGNPIIGKITLAGDATFTFAKSTFWSTSTYDVLYVVADWEFDSVNKYVSFSIETDTTIGPLKANDDTDSHILVLSSLLNNKFFSTNWGANGTVQSLSNYHIVQDFLPNIDLLVSLEEKRNSFNVFFDSYGYGLYVGSGKVAIGGTISSYSSSFYNSLPYPTRGNITGQGTGITLPPVGLRFFVSNVFTNVKIDVIQSATKSSYYQIDFLRYRINASHLGELYWESFLQLAGTLDFAGNTLTKSQIIDYLTNKSLVLKDDGITLAIVVRSRASVPDTQNNTNLIWPEWTIIPKIDLDDSLFTTTSGTRLKVPVYRSKDIGF